MVFMLTDYGNSALIIMIRGFTSLLFNWGIHIYDPLERAQWPGIPQPVCLILGLRPFYLFQLIAAYSRGIIIPA